MRKKVMLGSTVDLLKKQNEEMQESTSMKQLAAEVAAIAAAKSEMIRRKNLQKYPREYHSDEEDGAEKPDLFTKSNTIGTADRSKAIQLSKPETFFEEEQSNSEDDEYYDYMNNSDTDSDF